MANNWDSLDEWDRQIEDGNKQIDNFFGEDKKPQKIPQEETPKVEIESAVELPPPEIKNINDIKLITVKDIKKMDIPPRKYLLYPSVVENTLILVVAGPGVGKSVFLLSLFNSLCKGENKFIKWLNCTSALEIKSDGDIIWDPITVHPTPQKCLYLDGEMSIHDVDERIKDLNIHDNLIYYPKQYQQKMGDLDGNLSDEDYRDAWFETIIRNNIKVVCFDNIASLWTGSNENTTEDWSPMNQWLIRLRAHDITVFVVHHTGKSGDQRGSSHRVDNVDARWDLTKSSSHDANEGAKFDLRFEKYRQRPNKLLKSDTFHLKNGIWQVGEDTERGLKLLLLYYITRINGSGKPQYTYENIVEILERDHDIKADKAKFTRLRKSLIGSTWLVGDLQKRGDSDKVSETGVKQLEKWKEKLFGHLGVEINVV